MSEQQLAIIIQKLDKLLDDAKIKVKDKDLEDIFEKDDTPAMPMQ